MALASVASQATTTTGKLIAPRMFHTASALPDGRILLSGGYQTGTSVYTSTEIYDPASGVFTLAAPLTVSRSEHAAAVLADGRVLVAGGSIARSTGLVGTNTAEIYDPATGQWSTTGNMNVARARALARALPDGRVMVLNPDNYSGVPYAEVFDPQTGVFTKTGNMVDVSGWHGVVVLADGRVMKIGGWLSPNYSNRAEIWDPATNQWSATGPMLEARQDIRPVLLPDGKVLVAGGSNISTLKTTEIYDPATGLFSAGSTMPEYMTVDSSTVLPNGNIILTGPYSKNLMHYQIDTGLWNVTGPKQIALPYTTVTRLPDGNLLLAGGSGQYESTALASVWDFACATQKIGLAAPAQSLSGDGGPVSWIVTGAPGCRFEMGELPAWLSPVDGKVMQMPATGSMAVSFIAAGNTSGASRSGTFMLANSSATLTQALSPVCPTMPTLSPFYTLRSYVTTGAISVTAAASCPWRISALPGFVTATSSVSGTGNGSVSYTVAANPGAARSGVGQLDALSLSRTFTMNQEAAPACPTAVSLTPGIVSITSSGGSGVVNVSAAPSCPWSVGTLPSWVTLPNGSSGTGNGSFSYVVAANPGAARSASTSVTGPGVASSFNLNQGASPCASWKISPAAISLPVSGSSGSVAVTAPSECSWTLGALPTWLSLTTAASGSGNGVIGYSAAANGGAARSATAMLSGSGPALPLGLSQASPQAPSCMQQISSSVPVNTRLQATGCATGARGVNYYTDRYAFVSAPGRQVTITLSSSAFDTYVFLRDPSNNVIKSDDDGGGGTNSRIPYGSGSFTLPAGFGGTYTIEVSSFGSYGSGNYSVTMTQ